MVRALGIMRVRGGANAMPVLKKIVAHCPQCRSELSLGSDQAAWLADGKRSWLFCPVCSQIVAAQPTVVDENMHQSRSDKDRPQGQYG